jgi:hypothetical protein
MINCKRCDIEITFDDSKCLSVNTRMPHDVRKCKTKPGYVYCPEHRESFVKTTACSHYHMYGWKPHQNEVFFLKLITEKYTEGDWFQRRNQKKVSGDKMKEVQICEKCNKIFPANWDRTKTDAHERECNKQMQLI